MGGHPRAGGGRAAPRGDPRSGPPTQQPRLKHCRSRMPHAVTYINSRSILLVSFCGCMLGSAPGGQTESWRLLSAPGAPEGARDDHRRDRYRCCCRVRTLQDEAAPGSRGALTSRVVLRAAISRSTWDRDQRAPAAGRSRTQMSEGKPQPPEPKDRKVPIPSPRPPASADGTTNRVPGHAPGQEAPTVPSRRCGRCRGTFPGDPTLHPTAQPEWWICPPCREALLGADRRHPSARRSVRGEPS